MSNKILDFISFKLIPLLTGDNKKPEVFITNKSYLNWKQLNKSMQKSIKYIYGNCIDIGSGDSPYKKYILENVESYTAIDKNDVNKHMLKQNFQGDFLNADIMNLPLENSSIDTVILTQVLEHIEDPFKALSEVKRVMKDDAILILSVPFIYHAHIVPYDYFRFSEYSLRKICKDYNFEIVEFHYQGYFGTAIFSIINDFIWTLASKNKLLRNIFLLPFIFIIFAINNLFGMLLDKIKLKNFTPNFWLILKNKN